MMDPLIIQQQVEVVDHMVDKQMDNTNKLQQEEEEEEEGDSNVSEIEWSDSEDSNIYDCVITDDDDEDDEEEDLSFVLPRETMKRIVREITEKVVGEQMRISGEAFEIIREAATGQLVEIFRMCNRFVQHADRNTIMSQDLKMLLNLIRDLYGPNHLLLERDKNDNDLPETRTTLNSSIGRKNDNIPINEKKKKKKKISTLKPKKASLSNKKTTSKRKTKNKKKLDDEEDNSNIEMDVEEKAKYGSKKRKLEQLDKIEEESRRIAREKELREEDEEKIRMKKREKREEIKRKSLLLQQESLALVQQFENEYHHNNNFHRHHDELEPEQI